LADPWSLDITHDNVAVIMRKRNNARKVHQWDDYAKRTADSAYTPRAERQLESLAPKYAEQWTRIEGRELQSVIAARVVRLDLTEEQFKMLGKAENVDDAVFRARGEDRKFEFMDGMVTAGYDKDSKQFFGQVQRKDIPALEQKIHNLMQQQQQQSRDFEIER
jgi:hypothetical protein